MLKPLHLLARSVKQFAIGLGPAFAMALVCLAVQIGLWHVLMSRVLALFPTAPERSLEEILSDPGREPYWLHQAGDAAAYTTGLSVFFFFHALVALMLTAWLLNRHTGLHWLGVLRRAARGAGLVTCGAAVVFAVSYLIDDVFPATRYVRFDFTAAGMIAVWFGGTALLLPARLMGHEPTAATGLVRNTVIAGLALVPWFYVSEIVGAPIRHCRECGGFFEGIFVFLPVLGAYLFGLTVSSAAVSAAACMPADATRP